MKLSANGDLMRARLRTVLPVYTHRRGLYRMNMTIGDAIDRFAR